jgi:DNA-directed RNA polymerase specialized sigma24 family protein
MSIASNASGFATTRWTLVARTHGNSPEAKAAIRELCDSYYGPVVAFIRREEHGEDSARELAHEFFARLLSGDSLANADQAHGRFRNYLLGAVKHFLINKRRESKREKRGGGAVPLSISPGTDTSPGIDVEDSRALPADAIFDREWAVAIIERAMMTLERESTSAGNFKQFSRLKPWISPAGATQSQAQTAIDLDMTEGGVKVAIHRLRRRFRELVRSDIAQTLDDPTDLDAEMKYLVDALATCG